MRIIKLGLAAILMSGVVLTLSTGSAQTAPPPGSSGDTSAGTVTLVTGHATAATTSGQIRNLFKDSKVFSGETLVTASGSYLNVVFRDGGRVLLRPESRFVIERYQYTPNQGAAGEAAASSNTQTEHESAFFRLLKGGFRAISGLIGHVRHRNYSVQTPVATIGIRGTDYEVRYCNGDCGDIQPAPRDGLYAGVQSGGIVVSNQSGQITDLSGQYSFVAGPQTPAVPLPLRPPALGKQPLPDPRTCN